MPLKCHILEYLDIFGVNSALLHISVQNHPYAVGEVEPHLSEIVLEGLLAKPIQADRDDGLAALGHTTATHL